MAKKTKKLSTKPTNFITKTYLSFQLCLHIHTLCLFTNKEVMYRHLKIWTAVSQPNATNVETRCHPIIIWNNVTSTSYASCPVYSKSTYMESVQPLTRKYSDFSTQYVWACEKSYCCLSRYILFLSEKICYPLITVQLQGISPLFLMF